MFSGTPANRAGLAGLTENSYAQSSSNLLRTTVKLTATALRFGRGSEIYGANEPADHVYEVVRGAVRTSKVLQDGRRQIVAFYSPGDLFGLEIGDTHILSAEAVIDSAILIVKRGSLMSLASRNNNVARQLWDLTAAELERARRHMLLLMNTAQERLAIFLLQMAKLSMSGADIELTMSRQDIADYLGLRIETVSRTLTEFAREAIIEVLTSRHIVIRNPAALRRLCH